MIIKKIIGLIVWIFEKKQQTKTIIRKEVIFRLMDHYDNHYRNKIKGLFKNGTKEKHIS